MGAKILIADDDFLLRDLLKDILSEKEYEVVEAEDGLEALQRFGCMPDLDLAVLDIMMPGRSGMEVLQEIRKKSDIPVLILTALGDSESEVAGLEQGDFDYISKPFHPEVLIARIEKALEYSRKKKRKVSAVGSLTVDEEGCRVYVEGKEVTLTNKEYHLLLYLIHNQGIVLTRNMILERIWGFNYEGEIRTIDTHIKMLRMDLGSCGGYIRTVRGIGYTFDPD